MLDISHGRAISSIWFAILAATVGAVAGAFPLYYLGHRTVAGSLLWSAALAFAGYALGAGYEIVDRVLDPVAWVVILGALAMYLYRVIKGTGGGKSRKS